MIKYCILFSLILFSQMLFAQDIREMAKTSFDKTIKNYPNLKNAKIDIKVSKKGSALSAAYKWWSVFRRPEKRQYSVRVNEAVKGNYMCFQFDHLSEQSRDGVLGHELAHLDLFHSLKFFGFLKFILNQALPKGIKKSERATDYRAIKNGLGKELRSWSQETRTKFSEGSDEGIPTKFSSRYLTPAEVDSVMKLFPNLYSD